MAILSKLFGSSAGVFSAMLLSSVLAVNAQLPNVPAGVVASPLLPLLSNSVVSSPIQTVEPLSLDGILQRAAGEASAAAAASAVNQAGEMSSLAEQLADFGGLAGLVTTISDFQQLNPTAFREMAEQLGFGDIFRSDGQLNQTAFLERMGSLMADGGSELTELFAEQLAGDGNNTFMKLAQQLLSSQANAGIQNVGLPLADMALMAGQVQQVLDVQDVTTGLPGAAGLLRQSLLLPGVKAEENVTNDVAAASSFTGNENEAEEENNVLISKLSNEVEDVNSAITNNLKTKLSEQVSPLLDGATTALKPAFPVSINSLIAGQGPVPVLKRESTSASQQLADRAAGQVLNIAKQAQQLSIRNRPTMSSQDVMQNAKEAVEGLANLEGDVMQNAKEAVEGLANLEGTQEVAHSLLYGEADGGRSTQQLGQQVKQLGEFVERAQDMARETQSKLTEQAGEQLEKLGERVGEVTGSSSSVAVKNNVLGSERGSLRIQTEKVLEELAEGGKTVLSALESATSTNEQLSVVAAAPKLTSLLSEGGGVGEVVVGLVEQVGGGEFVEEMTDLQRQQGLRKVSSDLGLEGNITPSVSEVLDALSVLESKRFENIVRDMTKYGASSRVVRDEKVEGGGRDGEEKNVELGNGGGGGVRLSLRGVRSDETKRSERSTVSADLMKVVKDFVFQVSNEDRVAGTSVVA